MSPVVGGRILIGAHERDSRARRRSASHRRRTPPRTLEANPAVAAALVIAGVESRSFVVGGAQALRPSPTAPGRSRGGEDRRTGHAYVAAAKRQVRGTVEIDHDAGPSEVVVLADATADPELGGRRPSGAAEHGSGDETVVLVTPSRALARETVRLVLWPRWRTNVARARRALARQRRRRPGSQRRRGHAGVTLSPRTRRGIDASSRRRGARTWRGRCSWDATTPVAVGDVRIGPTTCCPPAAPLVRVAARGARFSTKTEPRPPQRGGLRRVAEGWSTWPAPRGSWARAERPHPPRPAAKVTVPRRRVR